MRMIKKICSVICAAVIALGGVNIVVTAQDTESQIKYNYKISMESAVSYTHLTLPTTPYV